MFGFWELTPQGRKRGFSIDLQFKRRCKEYFPSLQQLKKKKLHASNHCVCCVLQIPHTRISFQVMRSEEGGSSIIFFPLFTFPIVWLIWRESGVSFIVPLSPCFVRCVWCIVWSNSYFLWEFWKKIHASSPSFLHLLPLPSFPQERFTSGLSMRRERFIELWTLLQSCPR